MTETISDDHCGSASYRNAMRPVPGAVAIITAALDGERNGMTATAVCSLSAEPPQLLVCVNKAASVRPLISRAGHFAVNFLRSTQQDAAALFSQSKLDPAIRFASGLWIRLHTGAPVLRDAASVLDCSVVSEMEHGSHAVFVGLVRAVEVTSNDVLIYHDGKYLRTSALSQL